MLELQNQHALHVSLWTVDQVLREASFKKWLVQTHFHLTTASAKKRLDWALVWKDWTAADFQNIVYSHKCTVRKLANLAQNWVFLTPEDKWLADCINPQAKANKVGLMVWDCFWCRHMGQLALILENMVNQWVYIELLEDNLLPVMGEIDWELGESRFQQDNAWVHTARNTRQLFRDNAITLEDHPLLSPDLNPSNIHG